MATDRDEGEPLELTEELEVEEPAIEQAPAKLPEEGEEPDEEETVIGFGDDAEEQPDDNSTIRHLREKLKEKDRELSEVRKSAPQPKKVEIGEKPTLEACGYDEEQFETELTSWHQRKADAEAADRKANEAEAEVQMAWQQDVASFNEKKAKLAPTVPDLDDLQQTVTGSLDLVQQAVMVKAANDPALFMVALGKNPAKLAELAKIKDPIKLASAIARMEGGIKVVTKRKAPAPDRAETGGAAVSGSESMVEKQLEKLETESERTGDRTKIRAFKKKHGLL